MSHVLFAGRNADNQKDVRDYKNASKKAKHGIKMVMDGLEEKDDDMIVDGARMALMGIDKMCKISDEMEERFDERDDYFNERDDWEDESERRNKRHGRSGDWDESEDERLHKRIARMYRR